ncbi:MAG: CHAT domain-containing protein [Bacteroidetes bacterium]|nr:CHAT domain-containing protein [Bacteroidota bacterium]
MRSFVFHIVLNALRLKVLLCFLPLFASASSINQHFIKAKEHASNYLFIEAENEFRKALKIELESERNPEHLAEIFFARQFNFQNIGSKQRAKHQLDSFLSLVPQNDFQNVYRKYQARSYYLVFIGQTEKAFIQLNKAIELAQKSLDQKLKPEVFLNLYFDKADLTGRLGNKQSEIDQHQKLIPQFLQAQLYTKAVQSAHGIAVHYYGFNAYDSCLHYSLKAQQLAKKYNVMQDFIGLYQYNAVCLALLNRTSEASQEAVLLENKMAAAPTNNRWQAINLAEALRIHSRYYSIKNDYKHCIKLIDKAVGLVENLDESWDAKAAMYAYHGRLCIQISEVQKAKISLLKQVQCRQINQLLVPKEFEAPEINLFEPNMYSVSALSNYAEVLYRQNAALSFKDSALNAGVISYSKAYLELLWLALERLPNYSSRLMYLQRMEWYLTFYATAIFQQYQSVGLFNGELEEFYKHTSFYHQQYLRSSNEKKSIAKTYSGSDSLFRHLMNLNSQYNKAQFESNRVKRDSLDQVLVSLNNALSAKYPEKFRAYYEQKPVLIDDIQKSLGHDECLVVYEKFYINLYQLVLTKDSLFFDYLFTTPKVDSLIEQQQFAMQSGNADLYALSSHQLYKRLFLNKLPNLPNVHLVPVANLANIPFDALVVDSVSNKNFKQLPYWIKTTNVKVWSSLYEFNERNKNSFSASNYLAAAPKFEGEASKEMLAMRSADRSFLVNIPGAQKEVEQSSKFFQNAKLLTEQFATETLFKAHLAEYDIIHLATHALLDDDPLKSRLFFGETDSAEQDGVLFAQELMAMDINAKLAILSACNTGSGKAHYSEGRQSLAYAFAYGGCPNVLMTYWNSSDHASSSIITSFVEGISQGKSLSNSLNNAKMHFLEQSDEIMANPYYWSGFGIFGNLDAQVKMAQNQNTSWKWWFLALIPLLIFALRKALLR